MSTNRRSTWQPILDGEFAERAHEAVEAITAGLRSYERPAGASLAEGEPGMALYFHYLSASGLGAGKADASWADRLLGSSIDAVASTPMLPSFYGGFPGVAWAAEHIRARSGAADPGAEDVNEDVDGALLTHLDRSPWRRDYDIVHGLVGLGVYALERLPRPSAAACLELIVQRLEELAVPEGDGLAFHTHPRLLIQRNEQEHYPNGYYNAGVAHGVAGVIALLGALSEAGVCVGPARRMLRGALRWLWRQQVPDGRPREGLWSVFPRWVGPDITPRPSRTGWCYGDLGIAIAVLHAARALGDEEFEARAVWLARQVEGRPAERTDVIDAGLCHGAAGMGHLFNRLFQATAEEAFRDSAREWFERALQMRVPGRGLAGYLALKPLDDLRTWEWMEDPGLLTGVAGVGLSLLGALTPSEPTWDRMLLPAASPACAAG